MAGAPDAGCMIASRGTDAVRVVVAGELPREAHNAPLHLFSASPDLVGFGSGAYRRRSENTSRVLYQLFAQFRGEGLIVPYTMADFERDFFVERFLELTPKKREEWLRSVPAEERLAGLTPEEIRQYLDRVTAGQKPPAHARAGRNRRVTATRAGDWSSGEPGFPLASPRFPGRSGWGR